MKDHKYEDFEPQYMNKAKEYNVKSIMSSVIINSADSLDLVINGPDENQAADALNNLFPS